MEKVLLGLFICVFGVDSFANDIAANVTNPVCDNDTLSKYNGTVNVEINWEPNVIDLRWYDGNTLLTPSNSASNSCTYDGDMYIPDAPTKTGYTFQGWRVRPQMDFSTIDKNDHAIEIKGKGITGGKDYCWYLQNTGSFQACIEDEGFNELQPYEWKTKYTKGELYGMSGCSSQGGTFPQPGNPTIENGTGQHCWCKATGYKPTGSNVIFAPTETLPWIYSYDDHNGIHCEHICAHDCAVNAQMYSLTNALFTPVSD